MADINPIWRQVILSQDDLDGEVASEEHYSQECKFIARQLSWTILGTRKVVYVLLRKCDCGKLTDKSNLSQTHVIYISEFGEGVELHLTNRCHYRINRTSRGHYQFRKICYCPKDNTGF